MRCFSIGAAAVVPALLIGVLGSTHPDPPRDSGLVACAYQLSTKDVPQPTTRNSAPSSPAHAGRTCAMPGRPTSIWPCSYSLRSTPTDTRPSGSTSGYPPPAQSTDSEQHLAKLLRDLDEPHRLPGPPRCPPAALHPGVSLAGLKIDRCRCASSATWWSASPPPAGKPGAGQISPFCVPELMVPKTAAAIPIGGYRM